MCGLSVEIEDNYKPIHLDLRNVDKRLSSLES